jgi:hypothetical protein
MRTAAIVRALLPVCMFPAGAAHASFLSGEALDTAADVIAILVLIVVPVVAITVFWLVHILPEKIAEQRHHPQKDAIKTLCLLSLVFGGMLWPFAWIWAYGKPVLYKLAYGRDKHEDYFRELAEKDATDAGLLDADVRKLRTEIDVLAARGTLPPELVDMRQRLVELEARVIAPRTGEGAA